jgi:four helix bundle protein
MSAADLTSAPVDLATRTRAFAVRVMRLGDSLPRTRAANVIAYQIIRAASSVGAHYREGMRSRSDAELVSKFEGALMELEETSYWLELLVELNVVTAKKLALLRSEAEQLTAILVTCVKKVKRRIRR